MEILNLDAMSTVQWGDFHERLDSYCLLVLSQKKIHADFISGRLLTPLELSEPQAIPILENEKLLPSWLKLLMRQQEDELLLLMVHMHRDIATSKNKAIHRIIVLQTNSGHALPQLQYGPAGKAIGSNLLNNLDAVANDPTISFKTALWFSRAPQTPKPSCHDAISGRWRPLPADSTAGRVPGYGVVTNIINGGIECGKGSNPKVEDRIGFYKRYCDLLGVGYGPNLDCYNQRPFA
ncbi:unnamed protein product [Fraxinus pennsylvanica]|uniref:Glycoside hydrolase family 19 catalytic domain-containing protein n=1 Tax=Fraxinus pennsylvanica TaxID=56036 RepID=A0AAD2DP05_9LAMI|nr:unnamed protein product [Fraxinus pennsylvanica]